jgi:flagellar FliL protein
MATQAKETPADQAAPKKKRGKLIIIASALLVLGGGGAGGAWYFMRPVDPNAPKVEHAPKPAAFLALESFTVNLVPQEGQPQYLQAGLTLKLADSAKADAIKDRTPEVRNRILLVLSAKKASDLLSTTGKQKLAVEIADAIKDIVTPAKAVKAAAPAAVTPGPGEAAAATTPPAAAPEAAKPAAHAVAPAGTEIEVLFTSFIIQ